MNRARRTLATVIGIVVAAGGGGWYAGQQVQSPAEAAASRKAPPASVVTVPVESRTLANNVVAHGTVAFESPVPVALSGAVAAPTGPGGADGGSPQKVTRAPAVGASVPEGAVFMEVSGRPVFVLRGSVPMYRTLGPGAKGADVKQLNEALKRIGFDPGTAGDAFTAGTASALKRWYRARGYDAKEPGAAERQQLVTLEQAVQAASEALAAAKAELQAAESGGSGSSSGSSSSSGGAGGGTAGGDAGGGTAGKTSGSTAGAGTPGGGTAPVSLAALRQRVANAQKAHGFAQQSLAEYQAGYGVSLPAGELVFLPALPVRVDQVSAKAGDSPTGQVAKVTGTGVRVQATVPGVDAKLLRPGMPAELELDDGRKLPGKVGAVGAAAEPEPDGGGKGSSPEGEGGQGGEAGEGGAGTGSGGGGTAPSGRGVASGAPAALRIVPDDPAALGPHAGLGVKVTVQVGSTRVPVLAVPIAAVFTGADGQARVKVQRADGAVAPVPVTLGLAAAGFVAVETADQRLLAAGDRVVVGEQ
ncbi:peptidoglycan-binding domain-containing protein [Yinghuangia soli]|uniref:Peptidoglycan-binding protein n=1 Tax=Yinghuangia soli TaxID=2908204 RepID=A0AA41U511_9ACTN|nr:peptidoglycan-binding domain-containing protein [Yinghuangia soli]MCF2529514.1 peptidoglycan-binding protein [Yinghuangia soli]